MHHRPSLFPLPARRYPWRTLFVFVALLWAGLGLSQPAHAQTCTADQPSAPSQINCTANDVEIAEAVVLNGVTQCTAGEMVTLDLAIDLGLNANKRYDIGIYTALDGGDAIHGMCSYDDFPTTSPFKQLEGVGADSCGDIDGPVDNYPIRRLTTRCVAGPDGKLQLNSLILWEQNSGPTCAKVPGSPAKCNTQGLPLDVIVVAPLTVTKSATPADGTDFNFTVISGTSTLHSFALDNEASNSDAITQTKRVLVPISRTVTLQELVPAGWQLTSILCNGQAQAISNNAASLTSGASGLNCTVTNQKQARLLVQKQTTPSGDLTGFDFNLSGGPNSISQSFKLRDGEVYTSGFTLPPGAGYSVAETVIPSGWTQHSATCSSDRVAGSLSPAAISLAAGETVTCTFVNRSIPKGSITIRKLTDPTDVAPTFTFTASGLLTPTAFSLLHGASRVFADLPTGVYHFNEQALAGWQLKNITCSGQTNSQVTINGSSVRIQLALSENILCTYTNDPLPSISLSKTSSPNRVPETGGYVTYNFVVTNNRNEPVTLSSLSDNVFGELATAGDGCLRRAGEACQRNAAGANAGVVSDCLSNTLIAANSSYQCAITVWLAGDAPATHNNTAIATVHDDENNSTTAQASAVVTFNDVLPTIAVEKSASPNSLGEPGGAVVFTFKVTNSGQETVTLSSLIDSIYGNLAGQGTCTTGSTLAPAASYTCTISKTITRNFAAGAHQNTVTASAQDDDGNSTSASASAVVAITNTPAMLAVEKLASPSVIGEPGGTVTYTVRITNTSLVDSVTITQVVDARPANPMVDVSGSCALPRPLAPGQGFACTFSYTVSGNNGDLHQNTITARGSDDDGLPLRASANATVAILNTPSALALSKTASVASLPEPGGNVTFTAIITNISLADTITVTTLTDDLYGNFTAACSLPRVLTAGASFSCPFVRNVTGNAGAVHHNTMVVRGVDDDGDTPSASDDANVTITDVPSSLLLTKDASPSSVPESGGSVLFTVRITNTSAVDQVSLQSLIDSVYGNVAGTCVPFTLPAGGSTTCTFSRLVVGEPGNAHVNIVTVSGVDDDGNPLTAQDNAQVTFTDLAPQATVSKVASPTSIPETGGNVTFTFAITNTGAETITLTSLSDDLFGNLVGKGSCGLGVNGTTLAPNATYSCALTQWLQGDAPANHINIVSASVRDNDNNVITRTATATVTFSDALPTITLRKQASQQVLAEPGGSVNFTFTIQNTGQETVSLSSLTDSVFGTLEGQGDCPTVLLLAPGASRSCSITRTLTMSPTTGDHHNTATAIFVDDESNPITATATATVTVRNTPSSIAVTKLADRDRVNVGGETVNFTIVVTNTSATDSVTITQMLDERIIPFSGPQTVNVSANCSLPQVLTLGQDFTCTFSEFVPADVGTVYQNTILVTGVDDDGEDVNGQATATIVGVDSAGFLSLSKVATPTVLSEPGGVVTFTVTISNNTSGPSENITILSLRDTVFGDLNGQGDCGLPTLSPVLTPVVTCTFTQTITSTLNTLHQNTVTAHGQTASFLELSAFDDAIVMFQDQAPTIDAQKAVSVSAVSELGANVTFTLTAANSITSTDVITIQQVIDSVFGDVSNSCTPSVPALLAPDDTIQCIFTRFIAGPPGTQHVDHAIFYGVDDDKINFTKTTPDVTIPFTAVTPSVSVSKIASPSQVDESGGNVTFQVIITNTGQETATLSSLSDSIFGNLNGAGDCTTGVSLVPGASYQCNLTRWLAGSPAINHHNTLTATLTDDDGSSDSDSDDATVTFTDLPPSIRVQKSATPNVISEPGGTVTFTFQIANTGAETLTVTALTDTVFGNLNGQGNCTTGGTLAPTAIYRCTLTQIITRNFAAGNHQNTLSATVEDDETNSITRTDNEVVTLTNSPSSILVEKMASVATLDEPGGLVTYTVRITNTSLVDSVTITRVLDTRPVAGVVDVSGACGLPRTLTPNQGLACTFSYTVNGNSGDLHSNTLQVEGSDDDNQPVGGTATATVAILNNAALLQVEKIAGVASIAEPGGMITFTVIVTNASSADAVTINTLHDSVFGDVGASCTGVTLPRTLAVGASFTCQFSGNVSGNAGDMHRNILVASGVDDDSNPVAALARAQVAISDLPAALAVSKEANQASVGENGENVDFSVLITNSSSVDQVTVVNVVDSVFGDVSSSCAPSLPQTLAPGGTLTCQFSRAIAGDFGTSHFNRITVAAYDDDNQLLAPTATATVAISDTPPVLRVRKLADPASVAESGEPVHYTVLVENVSRADTITVSTPISDSLFGDVSGACNVSLPVVLLPGQGFQCHFTRLVGGDVEIEHTNVITVTGVGDDGDSVTGTGQVTVRFNDQPAGLVVSKTPSAAAVPSTGGLITFTLRVRNSSANDSVTLNTLSDSVYGNVADGANPLLRSSDCRTPQTLAVGAIYECHFSALIQGALGTQHRNLITVSGVDDDGAMVTGAAQAVVTISDPLLSATKRDTLIQDTNQNGIAEPGERLRYTLILRNDGNATAYNLVINDLPHNATTLINGSVTTSQGLVIEGNGAGQRAILIHLAALPPSDLVVITFDVTINQPLPLGVEEVRNQATIRGSNFPALLSDDPDSPTPNDPTITPINARPLLHAAKTVEMLVDADGNGVPSPGDTLEYRLLIVNIGNQDGLGVVANDLIDPNLQLLPGSVTTSQGRVISGNQAGDTVIKIELGVVIGSTPQTPGPEVIVKFRVTVRNPLPAGVKTVANQGFISADNHPEVPTDDPSTEQVDDPTRTPLTLDPKLEASKRVALLIDADGNQHISPGDTVLYQVTLINNGNGGLQGVVFADTLDANTTLLAGTVQSNRGMVVIGNNSGDRSIKIEVGTLAGAGGQVEISFQARINSPLPAGVTRVANQGLVTDDDRVSIPTDDPEQIGDGDITQAPVTAAPNLLMVKHWALIEDKVPVWSKPGDVTVGDTLLYRIVLRNTGNGVSAPMIFEDQPDAATVLLNGTVHSTQGQVLIGNNLGDSKLRINLDRIAPGEEVQISYRVRVVIAVSTLRNQASASDPSNPQQSPVLSDNPLTAAPLDATETPVALNTTAEDEVAEPIAQKPTAEDETAEPVAGGANKVYLPWIAK